jgi:integrase
LSDDELAAVWKACDELAPQYAAVVRFLVLTGQRLREVGHMRWSELSADLSLWTLPRADEERARSRSAARSAGPRHHQGGAALERDVRVLSRRR